MSENADHELEVNGEWPDLVGHTCESLIVEEYWDKGALAEPANNVWLRVDQHWHRLFIDCGIVYWRRSDTAPQAYEMPELAGEARLTVLEFSREVFESVDARATAGGSDVHFRFRSGRTIVFRDNRDQSSYEIG